MGIEELRKKINDKYGQDIMFSPAKDLGIHKIPRFSTGCLALDIDSGGGWPEGRMIEIYGPESSGKTYVLKNGMAIITNRKKNNKALLIDEEGDHTNEWAKKCGVNVNNLEIARSEYAEQALDIMELAVQSGEFALVALDSIAALIPKEELAGSTEDWQMALTARLMGKACRKMYRASNIARRKGVLCTIFFINQLRIKVGKVFGNPEVTTGGNAVKYAAAIRLDIRRVEVLKDENDNVIGQENSYLFVKNKTAPPLKKGTFRYYTDGPNKGKIDNAGTLADCGMWLGKVLQSGSWYSGEWLPKKQQGIANVYKVFNDMIPAQLNEYLKVVQKEYLEGAQLAFKFK